MTAPAALASESVQRLSAQSTEGAQNLVQSVDWMAIAPPAIAAVVALVVLVTDLFLEERHKPVLGWLATGGLALSGLAIVPLIGEDRSTFCLTSGNGACSYVADPFTLIIQLLVLGGAFVTALLSMTAVRDEGLPAGEFWFLLLSSASGAALLPASRDLTTLVVALEVVSLPAFALVGLRRGRRLSSEAALKFFLSSVTATAVMLLGVSFVYAATGSMHLSTVAKGLPAADSRLETLAATGVVLTLVGFAFKAGAAPFHFWVPETYVGAPVPVAAYLSVVGKAAGFTGLILVTVRAFPSYADLWGPALAVLAALTMSVGNLAALRQRADRPHSAVRLLAWSSVGQAGYLLVPIASAGYAGQADDPSAAIGATVAYALMYAVVNLGAFAVVTAVRGATAADRADGDADGADEGVTGHRLDDFRGLISARPLTALAMGFFLLCLAGLPPGIVGLFAKVTVFGAAVDAGLGWLAVVMAVNVVIALVYYLRWTALLFRAADDGDRTADEGDRTGETAAAGPRPRPRRLALPLTVTIALTGALALAASGAPQLLLRFADTALF
ncbi:NADH-quinone oxidoreductase subunit N [Streptomyces sp. NBC_01795]|uniref:NADH-quinone oxidoreductase subunit N n=1 Tax=unclassified Streptomyces TaxID=2593676 RepID=UPI002DDBDCE2|nr:MULTISPECIES: NADH-quinone oxidoreductase subunit N [unclassified Streptomyces]WSA93025.1 NADH-quinone oxidoreductase subunit N [Streptomyces sp. NBC_01795]WSS14339.1 NADH-quinone oxidoreductase subunit N [Streptomyces sp. NBC_01186]